MMKFTDICIITNNVLDVAKFYETIFDTKTERDNTHSFINVAGLGIAIYDKNVEEKVMGFDFSNTGTGLLTIGFNVDDVDAEYERIKALNIVSDTEPKLWPWEQNRFVLKILKATL